VARDRVISTVDTQARHGHKSRARTFDGYNTHLGVDPDDELITNVTVTPANTADRDVIDDLLDEPTDTTGAINNDADAGEPNADRGKRAAGLEVYSDSAYAGGQTLAEQACRGNDLRATVPPARNTHRYSKDQFVINPEAGTVTGPARHTAPIRPQRRGGQARFGELRADCPLHRRVHQVPLRAGDQHPPP
jgi:hypothetical protein